MDLVRHARLPISFLGIPVGRLLGLPGIDTDPSTAASTSFYGKHDPCSAQRLAYYDRVSYGINSYMRPASAAAHAEITAAPASWPTSCARGTGATSSSTPPRAISPASPRKSLAATSTGSSISSCSAPTS
jgi:hypothetical protein